MCPMVDVLRGEERMSMRILVWLGYGCDGSMVVRI